MDNVFELLQPAGLPINFVCVVLVLLSGIWQQRYLSNLNMSGAWKTLLVSLVFCIGYLVIIYVAGKFNKDILASWFFSYVTATSLYELLLKKLFAKWFPDKKQDA